MRAVQLIETPPISMREALLRIYTASFPPSEQKPHEAFRSLMNDPDYSFFVLLREGDPVGFTLFFRPPGESFALLEYMAIAEALRGEGLGSVLLRHSFETLMARHGPRPVLIEIDSPDEPSLDRELRIRRETFYRRLGCRVIDGFEYILGLKTLHSPPKMALMAYDPSRNRIPASDLRRWVETVYARVYGRTRDDPDIIRMFENLGNTLDYR